MVQGEWRDGGWGDREAKDIEETVAGMLSRVRVRIWRLKMKVFLVYREGGKRQENKILKRKNRLALIPLKFHMAKVA